MKSTEYGLCVDTLALSFFDHPILIAPLGRCGRIWIAHRVFRNFAFCSLPQTPPGFLSSCPPPVTKGGTFCLPWSVTGAPSAPFCPWPCLLPPARPMNFAPKESKSGYFQNSHPGVAAGGLRVAGEGFFSASFPVFFPPFLHPCFKTLLARPLSLVKNRI